jgi:5-methylcytosine-specific restriction endonuclease McrA
MEKLRRLKGLLAHSNPDGSYEGLFDCLAEMALKKVEPKAGNDAHTSSVSTVEKQKSRYIPVEIKRRVFARDGGSCTYPDEKTGRRCGSRFALQYDHVHPFAWGGETSERNLRIRCKYHNSYTARKQGLGFQAHFISIHPKAGAEREPPKCSG